MNYFEGNSTDEDYAPEFYIDGKFVWQTAKRLLLDDYNYRIRRTQDGEVVCTRTKKGTFEPEVVAEAQIPKEVLALIENLSFASFDAKIDSHVRMLPQTKKNN